MKIDLLEAGDAGTFVRSGSVGAVRESRADSMNETLVLVLAVTETDRMEYFKGRGLILLIIVLRISFFALATVVTGLVVADGVFSTDIRFLLALVVICGEQSMTWISERKIVR